MPWRRPPALHPWLPVEALFYVVEGTGRSERAFLLLPGAGISMNAWHSVALSLAAGSTAE